MSSRGEITRKSIMDAAEGLILEQGFAASSVDRIIDRAGVTKGTFFYHFPSKTALAHALVERLAGLDLALMEKHFAAAEAGSEDPLDQLLAFVDGYIAEADGLAEPDPGCLFASYCYEADLFDAETLQVVRNVYLTWRARLGDKLREVVECYPPRVPVSLAGLADLITVVFEGAFIVSKSLKDPATVAEQLRHYRNYLALLFDPDWALQKSFSAPAQGRGR